MAIGCPTCARDGFSSERAMKIHHAREHGESIAGAVYECDNCGAVGRKNPTKLKEQDNAFCNRECQAEWRSEHWTGEDNPMFDRVIVTCDNCGEEREEWPAKAEALDHHFCDQECMGEWRSENRRGANNPGWKGDPGLVCDQCGDEYRPDPNDWEESRFCSVECFGQWLSENRAGEDHPLFERVTMACEVCGDEFETNRAATDRRKTCSLECYGIYRTGKHTGDENPVWEGGQFPYGPGWTDTKKEAVRERDGRECQHCGRGEEEHLELFGRKHTVHHIHSARALVDTPYDQNDMENLVTLCTGECHAKWEKMSPLRPDQ